ncbi:hypothetical protein ANDO1_3059 [plant metagenome]|uniref:Uncharacterized protein n=1 Tax=plant metagenome TaxID=1297885 RepID=A0A484Q3P5_9ZZZZ
MKYATEVIDLLAAYPGRRFRMRHILNHVVPRASAAQVRAARMGVWRVLGALAQSGQVRIDRPDGRNGSYAEYSWQTITSDAGNP